MNTKSTACLLACFLMLAISADISHADNDKPTDIPTISNDLNASFQVKAVVEITRHMTGEVKILPYTLRLGIETPVVAGASPKDDVCVKVIIVDRNNVQSEVKIPLHFERDTMRSLLESEKGKWYFPKKIPDPSKEVQIISFGNSIELTLI